MCADAASSAWSSGDAYEPLMGRWSTLVAAEFVNGLGVPAGRRWLDVGCGTGALTRAALDVGNASEAIGVDRSAEFIAFARQRTPERLASFQVGDAQQLPLAACSFDAVVSGLALNFTPEPSRMLAEMARVARPGGVVGLYVWDYAEGMEMLVRFWRAAAALDPAAGEKDERRIFPICRPEALGRLFTAAGLLNPSITAIDVRTPFASFDDYWRPFLRGQGPSGAYVASLNEEQRTSLRESLRATLPSGALVLGARAWAGCGVKA